ncbi:phage integrase N-terminal SAM-like domain-containing protein [Ampullimonas aquatilis]|uniref:phage integrase N-terminal SAM-like domain-containing protein n=1 Tax=Ampullimonas aquatilis TaxID=1341549 RepID=UPI003C742580
MDAQRNPQPLKLLDQLRSGIRTRHYSIRTEDAYVDWVQHFILFRDKSSPSYQSKSSYQHLVW